MNFFTSKSELPGRLTIANAPEGRAALALVELVFGAQDRTVVHIACDDASMARLADMLAFFAPGLDLETLPAWDCLPYDRVSPNGAVVARRLDLLTRIACGETPPLVLTTGRPPVPPAPPPAGCHGARVREPDSSKEAAEMA